MDQIAVGAIIKRITTSLAASRANIKTWSDQIADDELSTAELQDTLNSAYSTAFVDAATEINQQTGKLVNPNIDSQKAATTVKLCGLDNYTQTLRKHRELLRSIQKKKNSIICEHERRGDLKAEVELLKLLRDEG